MTIVFGEGQIGSSKSACFGHVPQGLLQKPNLTGTRIRFLHFRSWEFSFEKELYPCKRFELDRSLWHWPQTIEFWVIWFDVLYNFTTCNCNCWNPLCCTHIPSSLSRHDAVLNKPTWREQKTPRDEKQNQGTHLQPYCSDEKHHRHKDVLKDVHPSVRTSQKKKRRMDRP